MRQTRKQKAQELLRTLQGGPDMLPRERLSAGRIRIWLDSWVIGPVLDLVPEFKVREPEPAPQPTERAALVEALRQIAKDADENARYHKASKGERQAWRAIERIARTALDGRT